MTATILIYNDAESRTCSADLLCTLNKSFKHKHVAIVGTDRHNFIRNINELNPSIIIIPEIKGEESFYNRHITHDMRDAIKTHVSNGAMIVSFCAGAYWMCEKIVYNPPHGAMKTRNGKDVFNIASSLKSYGPLSGYGKKYDKNDILGGCITVPLKIKTVNGWKNDNSWYGNGPGFLPLNNKLPDNIDVIARYRRIEDQPIAACSVPYGKGQVILSGTLPHYWQSPVKPNNLLWSVITHRMHEQLFNNTNQLTRTMAP